MSHWGRRRTWLLVGVVLVMVATTAACDPPERAPSRQRSTSTAARQTTTPSIAKPWTEGTVRPLRGGEAIVADNLNILGWWDGTSWRKPEGEVPAAAGTTFQRFKLGVLYGGQVEAAGVVQSCGGPGVELTPATQYEELAVAGVANLFPRQPGLARPTEAHQRAAAEVMQAGGVEQPVPRVEKVLRVDLEGDGTDEDVILADNGSVPDFEWSYGEPGDASIVFVLDAAGRSHVVAGRVVKLRPPEEQPGPPNRLLFDLRVVADVNGDGRMEIVTSSRYHEGGSTSVYTYAAGRSEEVLEAGCGS